MVPVVPSAYPAMCGMNSEEKNVDSMIYNTLCFDDKVRKVTVIFQSIIYNIFVNVYWLFTLNNVMYIVQTRCVSLNFLVLIVLRILFTATSCVVLCNNYRNMLTTYIYY